MSAHPALEAVGELVRPHKTVIHITPSVRYRASAPCLLRQLADCALGDPRAGMAGRLGSRAPINVDVLDLWGAIVASAYAWAEAVGVARVDPFGGQHAIPWPGRLLRTTAATAAGRGDFVELLNRVEYNAQRWAVDIRTMVTGQPESRGVRGADCPDPDCGQRWVTEERPGEGRVRVPAVTLTVREIDGGTLRWLTCLACGWSMSLGSELAPAGADM